jgi:hypothetical protein
VGVGSRELTIVPMRRVRTQALDASRPGGEQPIWDFRPYQGREPSSRWGTTRSVATMADRGEAEPGNEATMQEDDGPRLGSPDRLETLRS